MKKSKFEIVTRNHLKVGVVTRSVKSEKYLAIWYNDRGDCLAGRFYTYKAARIHIIHAGFCWENHKGEI